MKKKKDDFSEKYNLLFEKRKISILRDKKVRILVLMGVIAIGLAAASPFIAAMVAMNVSERIVKISQSKLDKIEEAQPFVEVPIFKENLLIQFPPDYSKVKSYKMSFDGQNLDFGNGYVLEMTNFQSIENGLSDYSLKPTKGYDPVENLLMVKSSLTKFQITNDGKQHLYDKEASFETEKYTAVRVTGNLLESVKMQKMKGKGSFLTLHQQNDIGEVKTGVVVNSYPSKGLSDELGDITQSYVVVTKYWLFPDGAGVLVDVNDVYLGNLAEIDNFTQLTESKIKEIDQFTNGAYSWLSDHFKMDISPN